MTDTSVHGELNPRKDPSSNIDFPYSDPFRGNSDIRDLAHGINYTCQRNSQTQFGVKSHVIYLITEQ